ncbi:hypothetical protein [Nocardiopsis sp. YSL2]|uniref:hypothetical protein n=1 Tax=Nocardiopsis sp. YSL2 TaxID=2939492 RepID=UPI0026F431FE|nr:hypothetical protein [Nocardiopsis sp. YSL2]
MRPDAEPRQPQSSPAPVPTAFSGAPASTAPRKRRTGRRVLVGVGAAVLVAGSATAGLAGGVVHGGASLQPLDDGVVPDAAEPAEAVATEEPGERAEYRGMSVLLPEGWTADTVTDEFGSGADPLAEQVSEEWLALYPEGQEACEGQVWTWTDSSTSCRHLKVLGPGGIGHGGAGWAAVTLEPGAGSTYTASGNPMPCPEGEPTFSGAEPERTAEGRGTVQERKAGGEPVAYLETSLTCLDPATSTFVSVEQRLWLLEEPRILLVDNYRFAETEGLLASAEW